MINQIALITILTDDVPRLSAFYRDVLHFELKTEFADPEGNIHEIFADLPHTT